MSESANIDLSISVPKLKGACSSCAGYIKNCRDCGQKIKILNGEPLDYHVGSLHRCRGSRRYWSLL